MKRFYTYILFSEKLNKHYIGFTSDIADRLAKHNRSSKGFTSKGQPWKLVYSECFSNKAESMKRERQLKKWKNAERIKDLGQSNAGSPTCL